MRAPSKAEKHAFQQGRAYERTQAAKPPPPADEETPPLTLEGIAAMSQADINERWPEVEAVLAAPR